MEGRVLAIVERAYRGAIEEQYANVLWLSHVLRRLRGDIDVLLRGNAVRYALRDQPHTQLTIGGRAVDTLPHYETEIRNLLQAGVLIYVSGADCDRFRVDRARLIPDVVELDPPAVARLFAGHAHVWHW